MDIKHLLLIVLPLNEKKKNVLRPVERGKIFLVINIMELYNIHVFIDNINNTYIIKKKLC